MESLTGDNIISIATTTSVIAATIKLLEMSKLPNVVMTMMNHPAAIFTIYV